MAKDDDILAHAHHLSFMRDDQDPTPSLSTTRHFPHHPSHHLSTLRIQPARGLIQDQQIRFAHNRPRNRDPLSLPATEACAPRADDRVIALREAEDELNNPRSRGRVVVAFHSRKWRVLGEAVGDVFGDGGGEHDWCLWDNGDESAQGRQVEGVDGNRVEC